MTTHGIDAIDANHRALATISREMQRQAAMISYLDIFFVLMIGSFIAAALTLFLKRMDLSKASAH
jgi:hypothetical protein